MTDTSDDGRPAVDYKKVAVHYLRIAFACLVSLFWTAVVLCRVLYDVFKQGTDTVFRRKERAKPDVLVSGWQHDSAKLSTVMLHYASTGERGKPLMLMLHGFPEFWYSWRHQMRHFDKDFWCVAVDMRGYNESDSPAAVGHYRMDYLAQDVHELVKALGYTSCTLVAHDWGGAVAWRTAAKYPQIVDKLVVLNCPHYAVFSKFMEGNIKQFLKSWYMFFFQVPYVPEWYLSLSDYKSVELLFTDAKSGGCTDPGAFSADDLEAYKYVFGRPGALTGPINYYRAAMRAMLRGDAPEAELAQGGGKITVPTLIVWGTEDVALSRQLAELSVDRCDKGTVRYVEGASHWVQQDRPAEVNEHMAHFLL